MNEQCRRFSLGWMVVPALVVFPAAPGALELNSGLSGAWYDPDRPGRGLLIEVMPERSLLFATWFTFDGSAQRWYSAQGAFDGPRAELTIHVSSVAGQGVETLPIGAAVLVFEDCSSARFSHDLGGDDPPEFALVRLGADDLCQVLGEQPRLPKQFRLRGTALGFDAAGNSADCLLDLVYEVKEQTGEPGKTSYEVTLGGHVQRTVLDPVGDGFSFWADVFNPTAVAVWTPPFNLAVGGPGEATDEHAFWRGLALLDGRASADGRAVGPWTCAGFSFSEDSGYDDNGVVAEGTWYIDPIR